MKKINTALCCFGMSGKVFHAPFLVTNPGFEFYGVWERSRKVVAEQYPAVKSFKTQEEMLDDPAIELVVVNTPNNTHFEYTMAALEAGKHVICEKPFTVTTWQAQELADLASQKGLMLSVFHNRRYDSDFRTVQYVLQQGWLGKIVSAELHFDRYKKELSGKLHKETPLPGAGIWYDLGSHLTDQAIQLFGMPQGLYADIAKMRSVSQVDDYFDVILYYNDHRVNLKGGYQVREPLPGYILHGSEGSFLKPKTDVQEAQLIAGILPGTAGFGIEAKENEGLLHAEIDGKVVRKKVETLPGNYDDYFKNIYDAIVHKTMPAVTAMDAWKVIQVLEAARQSSEEKRFISL